MLEAVGGLTAPLCQAGSSWVKLGREELTGHAVVSSHEFIGCGKQLRAMLQGWLFSSLLGDMLEAVRWSDNTPVPTPGGIAGGPHARTHQRPESPSAARVRIPVSQIFTVTLSAHPSRQMYLSGTVIALHPSTSPCLRPVLQHEPTYAPVKGNLRAYLSTQLGTCLLWTVLCTQPQMQQLEHTFVILVCFTCTLAISCCHSDLFIINFLLSDHRVT